MPSPYYITEKKQRKKIQHILIRYYTFYRHNGASRSAAIISELFQGIMWFFLRMESSFWQNIVKKQRALFPHINPRCPKLFDPLRYLLQSIWLTGQYAVYFFIKKPITLIAYIKSVDRRVFTHASPIVSQIVENKKQPLSFWQYLLYSGIAILAVFFILLSITQPFDLTFQFIFVITLWIIALAIQDIPGRLASIMMTMLALTIACRYIWWRYHSTLYWTDNFSLICGLLLLLAETYAWCVLFLSFMQCIWPLHRKPISMPDDITKWQNVDIFIPTYNEDLQIVKPTIYASLNLDWPKDKLTIYLLDDGNRPEFKAFAEEVGIRYITREKHDFAKAGNVNNALKQATGEFVAIFDCDHIPTRSFLQFTMGWFLKDEKIALVQTPHHFFSPDPFERNLDNFRETPNEGALFYGLVQDGNDTWDATFFCGSCAVLRRSALDEIGGIAVETVTEDAHTSLRLHRHGWKSAYIRIPQAAGLATGSLSAHINQRIRWAKGMVQIFRLDNPLFGKGLTLAQRLCYLNAMLHFFSGIPRMIFLLAPLTFLIFHAYIIYAPAIAIMIYVVPYLVHISLASAKLQGPYRHSFWGEIYETILAWYTTRPVLSTLFSPHKGKFNVTEKGEMMEKDFIDWDINRPYLLFLNLNLLGVLFACWRIITGSPDEMLAIFMCLLWVFYNLMLLGVAIEVSAETKQRRQFPRVRVNFPAMILLDDGSLYPCNLHDFSDNSCAVLLPKNITLSLAKNDQVRLLLKQNQREYVFKATIARIDKQIIGLQLLDMTPQETNHFIACTFERADTWAKWQHDLPNDRPLHSLKNIIYISMQGYSTLLKRAPYFIYATFCLFGLFLQWLSSLLPQHVNLSQIVRQS
ncbi:UDP-forming cellulose synthase catalytic subunit [Proteus myxofaciens]|uniref:Cellulose synthase catalytic subunit [UDP-forming] n=1 Tax=Proteus myxofaciens ATCC 19692 TaxID=1354337 RepID=A0A198GBI9_9GAMM|nr:UDP-forming cellulose synthase catalytic subunit [Proteus myxofaciens]OAT34797.1 cellulose synthase catalytic subunit [Proteus myxofaciens ATCC 19692]